MSNYKQQINGQITYYSDKNGNYNIFVKKPDGTQQYQLTNDKTKNICGVWSPDGNTILYCSEENKG